MKPAYFVLAALAIYAWSKQTATAPPPLVDGATPGTSPPPYLTVGPLTPPTYVLNPPVTPMYIPNGNLSGL